jgi:hypothetical protein
MLTKEELESLINSDMSIPTDKMEFIDYIPLLTLLQLDLRGTPESRKMMIRRIKILMDHIATKSGVSMRNKTFKSWTLFDSQKLYDEYVDELLDHNLRDMIKSNRNYGDTFKFSEPKSLMFCLKLALHTNPGVSIENIKYMINRISNNKRRFILTNTREIPKHYHPRSFGCFDFTEWSFFDCHNIYVEFINRLSMIKRMDRLRKPSGRGKKNNHHWISKFTRDKCETVRQSSERPDTKRRHQILATEQNEGEVINFVSNLYGDLAYMKVPAEHLNPECRFGIK